MYSKCTLLDQTRPKPQTRPRPRPRVDLESISDDKLLSEKSDIEAENLEERLEKLYFEDKAKNRNELLYILGKMLYYGKITLKKFRIVNKVLLDIEEDDEDEDKEKDDKWSLIQSTTD